MGRIRDECVQAVVEYRNDAIVKKIDEMGVRGCKLVKENEGGKDKLARGYHRGDSRARGVDM